MGITTINFIPPTTCPTHTTTMFSATLFCAFVALAAGKPNSPPAYSPPAYSPPAYEPVPAYNAPEPVYKPAPAYKPAPSYKEPSYDVPASYTFDYGVKSEDGHYGYVDFGQNEARDGYNTQGSYYVQLPDGRLQKVTYTVNGDEGYVAHVEYVGEAQYPKYEPKAYKPAPYQPEP